MPSSSSPIFEVPITLISCSTLISSHAPSSSCILLHIHPHLIHISSTSPSSHAPSFHAVRCIRLVFRGSHHLHLMQYQPIVLVINFVFHLIVTIALLALLYFVASEFHDSYLRGHENVFSSHCSLCHLQHTPALYHFDHTIKL